MSGPWEKYNNNQPKSGPWEKYSGSTESVEAPEMSDLEAGARGAVQGLPFVGSYADEAAGLGSAVVDKFKGNDKPFADLYREERDDSRKNYEQAASEHPKSFYGGLLASGAVADAPKIVPGLGQLYGAVEGGVYGLGNSQADLTRGEYGRAALDSGVNATLGAVLPHALEYGTNKAVQLAGNLGEKVASTKIASSVIDKYKYRAGAIGDWLRQRAEALAEKGTGATGREAEKYAEGSGGELLDRGITTRWASPANIAQKAGDAYEKAGKDIGEALRELDAQGVEINLPNIKSVLQGKIEKLDKIPGNEDQIREIEKHIANLDKRMKIPDDVSERIRNDIPGGGAEGQTTLPISSGEQAKRNFQGQVNWNSKPSERGGAYDVADAFRQEVEDQALSHNPELANKFIEDKKLFGLIAPIKAAAERRAATLNQSPAGGLVDLAAATAGGVVGGKIGAGLAFGANRNIRSRLPNFAAVTVNDISNAVKSSPQIFGKFGAALENAAARGQNSVAITHFLLQSTQPEYRALTNKIFNQESDDEN
jgi:hypothetical protein